MHLAHGTNFLAPVIPTGISAISEQDQFIYPFFGIVSTTASLVAIFAMTLLEKWVGMDYSVVSSIPAPPPSPPTP